MNQHASNEAFRRANEALPRAARTEWDAWPESVRQRATAKVEDLVWVLREMLGEHYVAVADAMERGTRIPPMSASVSIAEAILEGLSEGEWSDSRLENPVG